jgi:D-beta-D-heptose 7-phosphate kinase / D-beta-D-heptose 1-phosphate adenosyltransferase
MKAHLLDIITKFAGLRILILGDAILDRYLIAQSQRLCREGPVPVAEYRSSEDVPGGAAHTAVNVATLGGSAQFLSVIGNDEAGQILTQRLAEYGVKTAAIVDPARSTLVKQRIVVNGQLMLRFDQGDTTSISADTELRLLCQLRQLAAECDAVLVSDYDYGIVTPRIIETLRKLRTEQGLLLAVDSKHLERFKACRPTVVKPNYDQVVDLLHLPPLVNGQRYQQIQALEGKLLKDTGAQVVAVTLDREGAVIFEKQKGNYRTATEAVDNANTIGAGDTYISAFTLALAAGASANDAAALAAQAGRIVVQRAGTTPCWRAELQQALADGHDKWLQTREHLASLMESYRARGQRIVFTNGCFDILHPGHIDYLHKARALGDLLVVGVNTDESVKRYKGPERPINPLEHRIRMLEALACVDFVIEFAEDTPAALIQIVQPTIFVKGGDYTVDSLPEAEVVRQNGGMVQIIPFLAGYSTTSIINRIKQAERRSVSEHLPLRNGARRRDSVWARRHRREELYEESELASST